MRTDLLEQLASIAIQGDAITFPSRVAARQVRDAVRVALGFLQWQSAETAPKDGTHILVCNGRYDAHWTFNQTPPAVVHYWSNPGEEGFYLSGGIVEGSDNDKPVYFTRWRPIVGSEPK